VDDRRAEALVSPMAHQMKHQNEQQKLKALVRELERELSQGKTQLEALGETQERLQEADRICHELIDENRQLREKITDSQKRFAATEDYQREIGMLKQQLEALQIEHDTLLQSNRQMEEQLNFQRQADSLLSCKHDSADAMSGQSAENTAAVLPPDFAGATNATGPKVGDAAISPDKARRDSLLLLRLVLHKWRFGAILASATLAIAVAGVSIQALRTESPSSTTAHTETAAAEEPSTPASPRPSIAPLPPVRGTFQTVRATQVFSEPTEDSALVASIAKGVRLNVVDSREGWLEIRSKHGRPPGFIRREEAVRVGTN
jgi:hypothetical protein